MGESQCAKAEVHKVIPPLPVRTSRVSPPKTEPLPVYGRITVRKGGVHKVIPAPARAFSPRQPAYGRAPAR